MSAGQFPAPATTPVWGPRLQAAHAQRLQRMAARQERRRLTGLLVSMALSVTAVGSFWLLRRKKV